MFLVSHCLLIYIYEIIHDICLYLLCYEKSRSYFILLVFSTHTFMCLLSVTGIYRLIQLCCCLHLQLIDDSYVEFVVLGNIFVMGYFYVTLSNFFSCIFHTCVYVFVKCYRNIQVDSVMLLSTLATDR